MAKEKICGIYCIENLINGKKYIGQSRDIYTRWRSHKSQLNLNKHSNEKLQNAWHKYGEENFLFYILVKTSENELDFFEKYYIALYDSYIHGYNKDIGGFTNRIISTETRTKIANSKLYLTDEQRKNIRLAHKSKPIYQIDLDGNIINIWRGAREASRELGISQSGILDCLHHRRLTNCNYIWIFVDEIDHFNLKNYQNQNTQKRQIMQKDLNDNIIKIWDSANLTKSAGFDPSYVCKCCKTGKIYKGFLWEYNLA